MMVEEELQENEREGERGGRAREELKMQSQQEWGRKNPTKTTTTTTMKGGKGECGCMPKRKLSGKCT